MKLEWEEIHRGGGQENEELLLQRVHRTKVAGGWIFSTISILASGNTRSMTESSVFIPDPKHEWEVE